MRRGRARREGAELLVGQCAGKAHVGMDTHHTRPHTARLFLFLVNRYSKSLSLQLNY